jgi:hypothetical protein
MPPSTPLSPINMPLVMGIITILHLARENLR